MIIILANIPFIYIYTVKPPIPAPLPPPRIPCSPEYRNTILSPGFYSNTIKPPNTPLEYRAPPIPCIFPFPLEARYWGFLHY